MTRLDRLPQVSGSTLPVRSLFEAAPFIPRMENAPRPPVGAEAIALSRLTEPFQSQS